MIIDSDSSLAQIAPHNTPHDLLPKDGRPTALENERAAFPHKPVGLAFGPQRNFGSIHADTEDIAGFNSQFIPRRFRQHNSPDTIYCRMSLTHSLHKRHLNLNGQPESIAPN
jgi:hypothetical protein